MAVAYALELTPAERLAEVAQILAAGVLRARARLGAPGSATAEQVRVDFPPEQSVHAPPLARRRRSR